LLNVVQSAAVRAPRLLADALGTLSVITGVVVEFATVLVKSEPVVPSVNAATLLTPLPGGPTGPTGPSGPITPRSIVISMRGVGVTDTIVVAAPAVATSITVAAELPAGWMETSI